MNLKKNVANLTLAALVMCNMIPSVEAFAKTKSDIDSVKLKITSEIIPGERGSDANEQIEVSESSNNYDIESAKVTNAPSGKWGDKDNPKIKIILEADDDHQWSKEIDKDDVDLDDFDYSSLTVKRSSSSRLTITVTLRDLEYYDGSESTEYDLTVSNVELDSDTAEASWDAGDDAKSFELRLYRKDKKIKEATTSRNEYSFAKYLEGSGDYYVSVRAKRGSEHGAWSQSGQVDWTSSEISDIKKDYGNTSNNSKGTTPNKNTNSSSTGNAKTKGPGDGINGGTGNYYSHGVTPVSGNWTHLGEGNTAQWHFTSNRPYVNEWAYIINPYANVAAGQESADWFRFDNSGIVMTGWYKDTDGYMYFLNPMSDGTLGRMITGWYNIGGYTYFFETQSNGHRGAMITGTHTIDGNVHTFGADGKLIN